MAVKLKQLSEQKQGQAETLSTLGVHYCGITPGTVKLDKLEQLRKRKVAKGYTLRLVNELLRIGSPLHKQYERSIHCSSVLIQQDGKLTSRYCGCRWCYVCNRIRTAKLINGYKPVLEALPELRFVTLSRRNIPGYKLKGEIKSLIADFRRIRDRLRKQKILLRGVRKLEITYNDKTNEYHPHFHCIISGEMEANIIVQEWLNDNATASYKAQDNKPADEGSLAEVFKYVSKIAGNSAQANDTIFQAVAGVRLVQSMGGVKQISEDIETLTAEVCELSDDLFTWVNDDNYSGDWYSVSSGIALLDLVEMIDKPPGIDRRIKEMNIELGVKGTFSERIKEMSDSVSKRIKANIFEFIR